MVWSISLVFRSSLFLHLFAFLSLRSIHWICEICVLLYISVFSRFACWFLFIYFNENPELHAQNPPAKSIKYLYCMSFSRHSPLLHLSVSWFAKVFLIDNCPQYWTAVHMFICRNVQPQRGINSKRDPHSFHPLLPSALTDTVLHQQTHQISRKLEVMNSTKTHALNMHVAMPSLVYAGKWYFSIL